MSAQVSKYQPQTAGILQVGCFQKKTSSSVFSGNESSIKETNDQNKDRYVSVVYL